MLASRSLRLAVMRNVHPAYGVSSSCFEKTLPVLQSVTMKWTTRPSLAAAYSKDTKPKETPDLDNPPLKSDPPDNISASSSSTSASKSSPPSVDETSESQKTNECSTGSITDFRFKLPDRDQVESFVFKSLVYFTDIVTYIYRFSCKLFEKYIVNNYTVQQNWKLLVERMDKARKELKSK